MSGLNETIILVHYESSECKCGLNESISNSKQNWNYNESSGACKELDDWSPVKLLYVEF